jgi:hypothetical protein
MMRHGARRLNEPIRKADELLQRNKTRLYALRLYAPLPARHDQVDGGLLAGQFQHRGDAPSTVRRSTSLDLSSCQIGCAANADTLRWPNTESHLAPRAKSRNFDFPYIAGSVLSCSPPVPYRSASGSDASHAGIARPKCGRRKARPRGPALAGPSSASCRSNGFCRPVRDGEALAGNSRPNLAKERRRYRT